MFSLGLCLGSPLEHDLMALPDVTYVWQTTIRAPADLWLVHVDEDPRMTQRATTTVTSDPFVVHPSYGLFVNELDRSVRGRLKALLVYVMVSQKSLIAHLHLDNRLFEPRSRHCYLSGHLVPGPRFRSVWCL